MAWLSTRDALAFRQHNWVMWGASGPLQRLKKQEMKRQHKVIQESLRKAHERLNQDEPVHRQIYPAFGKKE